MERPIKILYGAANLHSKSVLNQPKGVSFFVMGFLLFMKRFVVSGSNTYFTRKWFAITVYGSF